MEINENVCILTPIYGLTFGVCHVGCLSTTLTNLRTGK